jgi:hypothetical protein
MQNARLAARPVLPSNDSRQIRSSRVTGAVNLEGTVPLGFNQKWVPIGKSNGLSSIPASELGSRSPLFSSFSGATQTIAIVLMHSTGIIIPGTMEHTRKL